MKWNQWKKQNNRLEALKYSVISDIKNIVADGETDLREVVAVKNLVADSVGAIKKLFNEYAVVDIQGKSNQIALSDIDVETLILILNQLELDLMLKYFNYPACCVEFFESRECFNAHDVNWGGFIPCMKHKDLSLEEITELLGRNPVTDDKDDDGYLLNWEREPESETVLEETYKNYILEVEDNHNGTFFWICSSVDEEGGRDDVVESSSNDSHYFFSKNEALENGKEFIDSLTN